MKIDKFQITADYDDEVEVYNYDKDKFYRWVEEMWQLLVYEDRDDYEIHAHNGTIMVHFKNGESESSVNEHTILSQTR